MWITFANSSIAFQNDERNATQQQPDSSTGPCFQKLNPCITITFKETE